MSVGDLQETGPEPTLACVPVVPFREVIARACARARCWTGDLDEETLEADAILATPEMQEIQAFFRWYDQRHRIDTDDAPGDALRRMTSLPPSVIAWVGTDSTSSGGGS